VNPKAYARPWPQRPSAHLCPLLLACAVVPLQRLTIDPEKEDKGWIRYCIPNGTRKGDSANGMNASLAGTPLLHRMLVLYSSAAPHYSRDRSVGHFTLQYRRACCGTAVKES